MRTRIPPKTRVRQNAMPRSPRCSVRSTCAQSVVPKGMADMSMKLRVSFNVFLVVVQNRPPPALLLLVGGRCLRHKCLNDLGLGIFLVELDDNLPLISKRVPDSLEMTNLGVLPREVKAYGSVLGLHAIVELAT